MSSEIEPVAAVSAQAEAGVEAGAVAREGDLVADSKPRPRPVIALVAGGTGGHVFPALAVATVLAARYDILLLTDQRGMRYVRGSGGVAKWGVETARVLPIDGARRATIGQKMRLVLQLALSTAVAALRLLRPRLHSSSCPKSNSRLQSNSRSRQRVSLVVTFGSYTAVPAAVAARICGVPLFIHEQNAILGQANRILQKLAQGVYTSFCATQGAEKRAISCGLPVRAEFIQPQPAVKKANLSDVHLVVMGGSQGARRLSQLIPAAIALVPPALRERILLVHQVPQGMVDEVAAAYAAAGLRGGACEITEFIPDPASKMAWADLVISRAGASTIAELHCLRQPALLIPLPNSADGHQLLNARAFASGGGGIVLEDHAGDGEEGMAQSVAQHLVTLFVADGIFQLRQAMASDRGLAFMQRNGAQNLALQINQFLMRK